MRSTLAQDIYTFLNEDLAMLQIINPIGYQEVVGDDVDDEMDAFENTFGELEDLSDIEDIESEFEFDEEFDTFNV